MPDAGTDPETMSIEAVQAELGAYRPGNAAEVVSVEEWLARRRALWRRLDELSGIRRSAATTPPLPLERPRGTAWTRN